MMKHMFLKEAKIKKQTPKTTPNKEYEAKARCARIQIGRGREREGLLVFESTPSDGSTKVS